MNNQKIRIKLKAYCHNALDLSAQEIVSTARRTGSEVKGPIPTPTNIQRFCVNRATFVNKKSREQYEIRTHSRLIDIDNPTADTVDALMKLDLSSSVNVNIKLQEVV